MQKMGLFLELFDDNCRLRPRRDRSRSWAYKYVVLKMANSSGGRDERGFARIIYYFRNVRPFNL